MVKHARILDFDGVPDPLDGLVCEVIDEDETGATLSSANFSLYRLAPGEYEVLDED